MAELPFEIAPDELARRRAGAEPLVMLDVREPWELDIVRFESCLAVPLAALPERVASLPRDRLMVVVCHHGMRSAQATAWLRAQGVGNAVNLAGGIDAWAREIDPAMGVY